jgi:hypothetical protein
VAWPLAWFERLNRSLHLSLSRKDRMTATGELIRMMNYVDDIAATLRRINASLYLITSDEKRRLAEYMRKSDPNFISVVEQLEKGA